MAQYRKKPVVIEAFRVKREPETAAPDWFAVAMTEGKVRWRGDGYTIETLEGEMFGAIGDFIIRGIAGEIYPCKPDIFAATYDPV